MDTKKPSPALRRYKFVDKGTWRNWTVHKWLTQPNDIFELIVTEQMIQLIVENTNLYTTQFMADRKLARISRLLKWDPVAAVEIRLFLAVLIYRGLVYKPRENFCITRKNKLIKTSGRIS